MPIPPIDLTKLTVDEKLELIDRIWDSLPEQPNSPLTPAQKTELDARIRDYESDPSKVDSWDGVKAKILKR